MAPVPTEGDVVVVGAGPAGSAAAARLGDAGRRVVLVEAGPGGPRPSSVDGLDLVSASGEGRRLVAGLQVRDRPGGPLRPYRQGFGLGGGSTVNGMLVCAGDRVDYERWVDEHGCDGWGPADLDPWLDRARSAYRPEPMAAGVVARAVAQAAADAGLAVGGRSSEPDRLGVLTAELAAVGGRRRSAADAHLDGHGPATPGGVDVRRLDGRSLTVVSGAGVDRVVAGTGSASHRVELATGQVIRAPQIVVAAGALGTPALIRRSGLTDRPIGRRLRDHPSYAFTLVVGTEPAGLRGPAGRPAVASTVIRWSSTEAWPGDLQAIVVDRVEPVGGQPLAVVAVGLMAVTAAGSLGPPRATAAGSAGLDVVTGHLGTEVDRRRLRSGVRTVAAWLRSPPVAEVVEAVHVDDRGTPIDRIEELDDAGLDRLIASRPGPYAHPAATCPMGPVGRRDAVAHHEPGRAGELIGRPGIRLADTSVFPDLVRGGLQLTADAVASRIAADLIDG